MHKRHLSPSDDGRVIKRARLVTVTCKEGETVDVPYSVVQTFGYADEMIKDTGGLTVPMTRIEFLCAVGLHGTLRFEDVIPELTADDKKVLLHKACDLIQERNSAFLLPTTLSFGIHARLAAETAHLTI